MKEFIVFDNTCGEVTKVCGETIVEASKAFVKEYILEGKTGEEYAEWIKDDLESLLDLSFEEIKDWDEDRFIMEVRETITPDWEFAIFEVAQENVISGESVVQDLATELAERCGAYYLNPEQRKMEQQAEDLEAYRVLRKKFRDSITDEQLFAGGPY